MLGKIKRIFNKLRIVLKAKLISYKIKKWLSKNYYTKVSIGENCNSSWYLKETGNKEASYPYDWLFSSGDIVLHTIKDEFRSFLNKDMMFQVSEKEAGHSMYHSNLFAHRNPLKTDEDYEYYERAVKRFLDLLKNKKNNILFICTVIQEPDKRPGWKNGFNKDFELPTNQSVETFKEMIASIQSINESVKFIFISQYTKGSLKLEIETMNSNYLWINFSSQGENSGSRYFNKLDDTLMKMMFKGMNQKKLLKK